MSSPRYVTKSRRSRASAKRRPNSSRPRQPAGDLNLADHALQAIRAAFGALRTTPFNCRKAGHSPFLRKLVIPFGETGYVAQFEIVNAQEVVVVAVRHQREDDYH